MGNYTAVILDFETTGLSPDYGDRAIEIGAVLIRNNPDRRSFREPDEPRHAGQQLHRGLYRHHQQDAEQCTSECRGNEKVVAFMAQHHLVAHNASFDRRFLDTELQRINEKRTQEFACSMLVSRRVYPDAPGHSLKTLVTHKQLTTSGVHHRALADAEMTGHLWIGMVNDLKTHFQLRHVPFDLMQRLATVPKAAVPAFLERIHLVDNPDR